MKTTVDGQRQNPTAAAKKFAAAARTKKKTVARRSRRKPVASGIKKTASELGAAAQEAFNRSMGGSVVADNKLGGREEAIKVNEPMRPSAYERRAHANLLETASNEIDYAHAQIARMAQIERMVQLIETLTGLGGRVVGLRRGAGDEQETLSQKLRQAARHQVELAEMTESAEALGRSL